MDLPLINSLNHWGFLTNEEGFVKSEICVAINVPRVKSYVNKLLTDLILVCNKDQENETA